MCDDELWQLLLQQKSGDRLRDEESLESIRKTENGCAFSTLPYEEVTIKGRRKLLRRIHIDRKDGKLKKFGWVINEFMSICMVCGEDYNWLRWKHHCRCCGASVCDSCSPFRVVVVEMEKLGPVRVCNQCFWGQSPVHAIYKGGKHQHRLPLSAADGKASGADVATSSDASETVKGGGTVKPHLPQTERPSMTVSTIYEVEGEEEEDEVIEPTMDEVKARLSPMVATMNSPRNPFAFPETTNNFDDGATASHVSPPPNNRASRRLSVPVGSVRQYVQGCKMPVVIDPGSGVCKAGFAGAERPTVQFPSIVGVPKYVEAMSSVKTMKNVHYGWQAQAMRGVLTLRHPIERGVVQNWEDVEQLWTHVYSELKTESQNHPVLLTEAPLNPVANRERMAQILFETFEVPAMYVKMQAVLALLSTGNTTGLAVDCGDGVTHTVPVFEGYAVNSAVRRLDLAGSDLTNYLMRILHERCCVLSSTADREIVRTVKEKTACVALDYTAELAAAKHGPEVSYELPDGNIISLGAERFRCAEPLFQPSMVGHDVPGLHRCVLQSIEGCEVDMRRQMFSNIYLSGGTSLLPGLAERVTREVSKHAPDGISVNVMTPADRQFSVWIGGSIVASLDTFSDMWVTKSDYAEYGASIVSDVCF